MTQQIDRGETLIEIVLAIVITAITITALVSSLATAGTAAQSQRDSVRTDTVMRNYAEATKAATRGCTAVGKYQVTFTAPDGFTTSGAPEVGSVCPAVGAPRTLDLSVTGPSGIRQTMQIVVRTP